jgi:cytochrome c biogenesis factor
MSKAGMDALKGAMDEAVKAATENDANETFGQIAELGATLLAAVSVAMTHNFHTFIDVPTPDGKSVARMRVSVKLDDIRPIAKH